MDKEIANRLKKIYRELYGEGKPANMFRGSNVGLALLGKSIEKAAETLAEAIKDSDDERLDTN